jgi:hypothetical protein
MGDSDTKFLVMFPVPTAPTLLEVVCVSLPFVSVALLL